jgi:hypothetical protein
VVRLWLKRGLPTAPSSSALLADSRSLDGEEAHIMGRMIVGVEPHKRSVTLEVLDEDAR